MWEHSTDRYTEDLSSATAGEEKWLFQTWLRVWVPAHAPHEDSTGMDGIQGDARLLCAKAVACLQLGSNDHANINSD